MFSGGSYEEVTRWLQNFVTSHAKRESPRVEGIIEAEEEREGAACERRRVNSGREEC